MSKKSLQKEKPNAIIIRPPEDGGITYQYVFNPDGQPWYVRYRKQFMYVFIIKKEGEIEVPYELSDAIDTLPEKLYRAIHGWSPVQRLLEYKATLMEKVRLGLGMAALGLFAVLIIMMIDKV